MRDTDDLVTGFARVYRGRHQPEDALSWLRNPDAVGPSSAVSPHRRAAEVVEHLEAIGRHDLAGILREAFDALLTADQRCATEALLIAQELIRTGRRIHDRAQHEGTRRAASGVTRP